MASKVLRDVVIYFNQDDTALKKIAKRLGATVSDSITKTVTHIIIEDKQNITRKMQRDAKSAQLVNKNWIKHCEKNKKRVSESDYSVKLLGSPKQDKENCENESQQRGSQHHGLMYSSPKSGPSSQSMQHEFIGSNGSNKTPRSPRRSKSKRHLTPNQSTDGGYDSERDLFLSSDEHEGDRSSERVRCENSFYTSPIKEIDLPANDNLKLLIDDGSDVANESTDDEGNAKSNTPKPRFADGSGQQTSDKNDLNDTTDDSTQVMDDKKKKGVGSESVDTAEQHPQDDSLNRTEELNNSIFNREPSTQVIKDTTIALSVQMMLESSDWMSSPASLPPLENLKQQSQTSPYRSSTPVQIMSHMDTENIINAAVYKKQKSDPTSLKVPEDPNLTDAESIEIPNEDEKDNNKIKEDDNSARKRKRGLSKSTPARPLKRQRSNNKVDEQPNASDQDQQSTSKPTLRRARTKELPSETKEDNIKPLPASIKRSSTRSKRRDPVVIESNKNIEENNENNTNAQHGSALNRSQRRHSKNFNMIRFLCSKCDDSVHESGSKLVAMMPTIVTFDLEAETLVGITHVVICKNERTLKVLQAIARGLYLVSSQWLHDCVEQKKILAADDYEAIDWFSGCRAAREAHGTSKLLFTGTLTWIEGETRVPVEELRNIIMFAGGHMAKSRVDADVVISNEKLRGKQQTSAPVVSEKWVLDSLVGWSLLPYEEYNIS
jgi:hypothetical protein